MNTTAVGQGSARYASWYFRAAALEAFVALVVLVRIPSEGGLSAFRLSALASLAALAVLGSVFALRPPVGFEPLLRTRLAALFAVAAFMTAGGALFLLRYLDPPQLLLVFERLAPLLWFCLLLSGQSFILARFLAGGLHPKELLARVLLPPAFVAFGILGLALVLVASTGTGITRDPAYWGESGVPILGWHAAVAIMAGFMVLLVSVRADGPHSRSTGRILLPLAIWALAAGLWLNVPVAVLQNSFYAPITPPAFQPFPYSDAGFYDYLSQSVLIGTNYLGGIPPRPLYVVLLAGLHGLLGQDYVAIIAAQTAILALFPVALYQLGRLLHSPAAGVAVALLATFRELVSLWISSMTRVANSKILTTDLPTTLGIALVCLVTIRWFKKRDLDSSLLAGGSFGLLLLLRSQSVMIVPAVLLLTWLAFGRRWFHWLRAATGFVLALGVTIAPWLIHNYSVSGRLAFDDPKQMAVIYSQYSFTDNLDTSQFDPQSGDLAGRLLRFTVDNPGYVASFVSNHALHTLVGAVMALPLIEDFPGLGAPVNLYWVGWNGALEVGNLLLVVLYLAIIALGLGSAWRRLGWTGLVPLGFGLGYALSNGIARFSSWRYDLPADWIAYFYFGIGTIQVLAGVAAVFGVRATVGGAAPRHDLPAQPQPAVRRVRGALAIVLTFALIGALPWLATGFSRPLYDSARADLTRQVASAGIEAPEIDAFLSNEGARIEEGRLLYPRHYRRGLGLASMHPWPAYAARDYPRLGFVLLNRQDIQAVFPSREALGFPHGAHAIVLGCQRGDYLDVRLITFPDYGQRYQSGSLAEPCD
jgi:hypothetical protein